MLFERGKTHTFSTPRTKLPTLLTCTVRSTVELGQSGLEKGLKGSLGSWVVGQNWAPRPVSEFHCTGTVFLPSFPPVERAVQVEYGVRVGDDLARWPDGRVAPGRVHRDARGEVL